MAQALITLLKRLAVLVMLLSICDMLLPDGAMRRYARLVGGLMTMWVMVSPLLGWLAEVVR
ncbi:MAG: stage III sporulation protein AF [Firmicutes bacterium]|nr:stage III sporulation protein AF [Bacillota bacterium]